jgi:ribosome biogenesis GTPase
LPNIMLEDLGWTAQFQTQADDLDPSLTPYRLTSVTRTTLHALGTAGPMRLSLPPETSTGEFAVGDWVLADEFIARHRLEPFSLLQRRASGPDARSQLMAANVETLGIVTACNGDFNIARLERYVAMAASADCLPLVILTRADEVDDARPFQKQVEAISPLVTALTLDARDIGEVERLAPWCSAGKTLALMGSSGVGKTTLTNGLTGADLLTGGIREDDARGRHTSTSRQMLRTLYGGWLIDTPGMRAVPLSDAADGIQAVFGDISELTEHCKFSDCAHETEPGCAVQAAVAAGTVDQDRYTRWKKLLAEEAHNTTSLAEARKKDREREKTYTAGKARAKAKRGS